MVGGFRGSDVIRFLIYVIGSGVAVHVIFPLSVQGGKSILTPFVVKDCTAEWLCGGDISVAVTVSRTSAVMWDILVC